MGHLTKEQVKKRLEDMGALHDIRVLGAVWAAASEEGLNEAGQEVMRSLHSPIATLQHMWCSPGETGRQLRALVKKFLEEQEG